MIDNVKLGGSGLVGLGACDYRDRGARHASPNGEAQEMDKWHEVYDLTGSEGKGARDVMEI